MSKVEEFQKELIELTRKYKAEILAIVILPTEEDALEPIGILGNMCMVCAKEGLESFIESNNIKHNSEELSKEIFH